MGLVLIGWVGPKVNRLDLIGFGPKVNRLDLIGFGPNRLGWA